MLFRDVVGQDYIKKQLIKMANGGKIPHALLFYGYSGIGKLPLALAYARYLLCNDRKNDDSCGYCHSCLMMNKLVHPDLHFIFPVIKKSTCNDYMDVWRKYMLNNPYLSFDKWLEYLDAKNSQAIIYAQESDELVKKLSLKSFEGGYKIIIIWLPEKMNDEAANKLLKLIEEPPLQTVFLLVSNEPDKILPTILSRTQRINIRKVSDDVIRDMLERNYHLSIERSNDIVHLANGSVTAAIEQIYADERGDFQSFFHLFVNLMRLSYQHKAREVKSWSDQLVSMGREKQKSFLKYSQRLIRESFIYNLDLEDLNYMTKEEEKFVSNFSPYVNEKNVIGISNELDKALSDIERNVNSRIVFFDFSLKMIMLFKN